MVVVNDQHCVCVGGGYEEVLARTLLLDVLLHLYNRDQPSPPSNLTLSQFMSEEVLRSSVWFHETSSGVAKDLPDYT